MEFWNEEYDSSTSSRESMKKLLLLLNPKFQENPQELEKVLDDFAKQQQKKNRKRYIKRKKEEDQRKDKVQQVNAKLSKLGVTNIDKVSWCLKRAILLGHISLDKLDALDQEIICEDCEVCGDGQIVATVRTLLYQPDYAGADYENCSIEACAKCSDCGAKFYVTCLCRGDAQLDNGKFHNHCRKCPNFGQCIGDYREKHCTHCGEHYFGGGLCYQCKGQGSDFGCKESEIDMNEEFSESEEEQEEVDEEEEETEEKDANPKKKQKLE